MFRLELLFVLQLVTVVILGLLLGKILQMKKTVDSTIEEVKKYILFVTEDEQENTERRDILSNPAPVKNKKKEDKDEAHAKLIQAVLGEYFL